MKLIDEDALLAWAKETYLCENASAIRKVCYKQLVEHLNTIEVKEVDLEVDLEKEFDDYIEKQNAFTNNDNSEIKYYNGDSFNHVYDIYPIAKHFFELGLKVQKGE